MSRWVFFLVALFVLLPAPARAANILFVSDSGADLGIATALMADGHSVTTMSGGFAGGTNPALTADLGDYDAVYWSQDGSGGGDAVTDATLFANLVDYVSAGGRVFVTGYDSVASPSDPMLVAFLGATGSSDVVGAPGPVLDVDNSLTTGVVDIRGVTPTGGVGDTDHLTGLTSDTVAVCNSASGGGSQWTLRALGSGEIAYMSNGSSSGSWTATGAGGVGAFNAAIRNFAAAAEAASSQPGAPEIEFSRVGSFDEGEEIVLEVTVTDLEGDPFTFSWDLDGDGSFGEMPGATTFTVPAGTTDGPSTIEVSVEASDGTATASRSRTLRVVNVDPMITSSPPTIVSVGAPMRYRVTVEDPGGDLDPPSFTLVAGPGSASFSGDTLLWTPTDAEVTMGDERVRFEIAVADGDMGAATQSWEMQVSPNRLPSSPRLLYPIGNISILDTTPRLAVEDAVDPDFGDTLTYFFELDDEETFAEPVLARGEMIPEAPGFTAYEIDEPLAPGRYYWRAWAFDGFAESPERGMASFNVVSIEVPDAGPATDAPVERPDAGAPLSAGRGGCACAASGQRPPSALLALLVLALAVPLARRRSSAR